MEQKLQKLVKNCSVLQKRDKTIDRVKKVTEEQNSEIMKNYETLTKRVLNLSKDLYGQTGRIRNISRKSRGSSIIVSQSS